jgi:hypothetical protein
LRPAEPPIEELAFTGVSLAPMIIPPGWPKEATLAMRNERSKNLTPVGLSVVGRY